MSKPEKPHIIVASVHKSAYSETFIRDHVKHLPFQTSYAWGGYLANHIDDLQLQPDQLQSLHLASHVVLRKQLVKYIKENQVKAVLAEYAPVGVHWQPVCEEAGIPLFVYCHGYDVTKASVLKEYGEKYKKLFAYAAAIFSVSHDMTTKLKALGAPEEKIVYNPCGVELALFADVKKPARQRVLSVGRLVPNKNPMATIRAFAKMLETGPDVYMDLVGDGPLRAECKALTRDLLGKKVGHIFFHGALPHDQVIMLMQLASVYIQHSVTADDGETEGAPVTLMEAGASALPVIATRHAGIPDIVEDGVTGTLVEENDLEGMTAALLKYLADPILAQQHGQAARERIEKYFTLERNIRILTETIQQNL